MNDISTTCSVLSPLSKELRFTVELQKSNHLRTMAVELCRAAVRNPYFIPRMTRYYKRTGDRVYRAGLPPWVSFMNDAADFYRVSMAIGFV